MFTPVYPTLIVYIHNYNEYIQSRIITYIVHNRIHFLGRIYPTPHTEYSISNCLLLNGCWYPVTKYTHPCRTYPHDNELYPTINNSHSTEITKMLNFGTISIFHRTVCAGDRSNTHSDRYLYPPLIFSNPLWSLFTLLNPIWSDTPYCTPSDTPSYTSYYTSYDTHIAPKHLSHCIPHFTPYFIPHLIPHILSNQITHFITYLISHLIHHIVPPSS